MALSLLFCQCNSLQGGFGLSWEYVAFPGGIVAPRLSYMLLPKTGDTNPFAACLYRIIFLLLYFSPILHVTIFPPRALKYVRAKKIIRNIGIALEKANESNDLVTNPLA